jgi:Flp pilus assembly protein TadD
MNLSGFHATATVLATTAALLLSGCATKVAPLPESVTTTGLAGAATKRMVQTEFSPGETVDMCLATANQLEASGHAREAAMLYEKARTLDESLDVSHRLALLYASLKQVEKAEREFQLAAEAHADDPVVLNDYGYFLLVSGRLDEARQWLDKALELDPSSPRARNNLAIALVRQGDIEGSLATFSESVGPASAHSNVGVLLARQGQDEEAVKQFRKALALAPDLEQARAFLNHLETKRH